MDVKSLLMFSRSVKTHLVRQSEASECGLACVTMIANYYGSRLDLRAARKKHNVPLTGMTIESMVNCSEKFSLIARPLKAELDDLKLVTLPAILHWEMDHFVVLRSITKDKYTILDPARGEVTHTKNEMSSRFTGIVVEFAKDIEYKKEVNNESVKLKNFWSKISGLKEVLIKLFVLTAMLQFFVVTGPLFQQLVIDDAITKQDTSFLVVLCLALIIFGLFEASINLIRSKVLQYLNSQLSFQMSINLLRHLLSLPIDFFEKRSVGDITTRFGSLGPIQNLLSTGLVSAILDAILAVTTFIMALIYSPLLLMLTCIFLAIELTISLLTFQYQRNANEKIIELTAKEQTAFLENIQAARTIKIFGQERNREILWMTKKADTINAGIELGNFNINLAAFGAVIGVLQSACMLYFGAVSVIDGALSLGMLIAFQSYAGQFSGKIKALIQQFISLMMIGLHLERLSDIVLTEKESSNIKNGSEISEDRFKAPNGNLEISLRNVSFKYGDDEKNIFNKINLDIYSGEFLLIKGKSGCGKTTLLRLLLGILSPTEGDIFVNDINLKHVDFQTYRKMLGVVMQDDRLLSGTLADNICFFDIEADEIKAYQCAVKASLDEYINSSPMGLNSLVGDMGSSLSGGQKQRLLIARALYRDPMLLILDEGTANLDMITEQAVSKTMNELSMTRIVISHGVTMDAYADRIIELKDDGTFITIKGKSKKMEFPNELI